MGTKRVSEWKIVYERNKSFQNDLSAPLSCYVGTGERPDSGAGVILVGGMQDAFNNDRGFTVKFITLNLGEKCFIFSF